MWKCTVCLYCYDEARGVPEEGISPGTKWEEIDKNWICPNCGVGKVKFVKVVDSVDQ